MTTRASLAALALALASCDRKPQKPPPRPIPEVPVAASAPRLLDTFALVQVKSAAVVSLPQGCSHRERPQVFARPSRWAFFAGDEPSRELALVERPQGDGPPLAAAIVHIDAQNPPRPLPLLPGPPLLARGRDGWLSLAHVEDAPSRSRALVSREGAPPQKFAEGEALEVVDVRCRDRHCVALTTRESRLAQAGASLFVGDDAATPASMRRFDLVDEGGAAERPFVIARAGDAARAAATTITAEGEVRFYDIDGDKPRALATLKAPHGALDAALDQSPVLIAHGAPLTATCATPRPLLAFIRPALPTVEVHVSAPVVSLVTRPLPGGTLAAWVAPSHCGDRLRSVVYAVQLDETGAPRTAPMAVTDGDGVALATRGDEVDLWLSRKDGIYLAQARCSKKP